MNLQLTLLAANTILGTCCFDLASFTANKTPPRDRNSLYNITQHTQLCIIIGLVMTDIHFKFQVYTSRKCPDCGTLIRKYT